MSAISTIYSERSEEKNNKTLFTMNIRPKQSRVQKASIHIQHNHTLLYLVNVCFSFYSSFNPLSFDSNFEEKVQNKHTKKF